MGSLIFLVIFSSGSFFIFSGSRTADPMKQGEAVKNYQELVDVEGREIFFEGDVSEEEKNDIEEEMGEDAESLELKENEEDEENLPKESEEEKEGIFAFREGNDFSPLPAVVKKSSGDELRIGFITDPHVSSRSGKNGERIIDSRFEDRITPFLERMNNVFVPDFMVVNGDVIEGTKVPSAVGMGELRSMKKIFERTRIPAYWVLGNHDLRSVTKSQWKQALGIDYVKKSFEVGNYRIIILDSNFDSKGKDVFPGNGFTRGNVSKEDLSWLEKELKNSKKKAVVFMHHPPLWDVSVKINSGLPKASKELQEIFSQNKVLAVFAGHIEDLYAKKINGVKYFVMPGMTKSLEYPGAFADITIKGEEVSVEMSYLWSDGSYATMKMKK